MMRGAFFTAVAACLVMLAACTYRFADPFPASNYDLVAVTNSTAEPELGRILEEEIRRAGGFTPGANARLFVAVTRFNQVVETVSSDGSPVRQSLAMEISWKVEGGRSAEAIFGMEEATELYLHSTGDTVHEDWNRQAAIRVLAGRVAVLLLERLEENR